jgi:IS5 family transposase
LQGEKAPARERAFSIFEPHTELIQRGRREKPVEFGHAMRLCQTPEKFITDYEAFAELEKQVGTPAIPRRMRDFADKVLRTWQAFRAGIEGTIWD